MSASTTESAIASASADVETQTFDDPILAHEEQTSLPKS
jgi:hypothetical protein